MRPPKSVLTLSAAAVLGAAGGAAVVGVAGDEGGSTTTVVQPASAQPSQVASVSSGGTLTAKQVYDRARDSVAFITAQVGAGSPSSDPLGQQQGQSGESTGSGFVVSRAGYLVTNAHVVNGASTVTVKIGDGESERAEVVGADESTDIALLKVAASDDLKPLSFADSDEVAVGDPVFAIGNPFGLDRTLTTGVVSALQRNITAPNGFSIDGVIQTDAPINPGNSGGPLLDASGEVLGVNSQILTGSTSSEGNVGIGFAAPSNTVANVVGQLERDGTVEHAYLGVQMGDAPDGGAQVGAVTQGGPAADGGVRAGDAIVAFDGEEVSDSASLSAMVNAREVGDRVTLTVRRGGEERELAVTLGEQPASADAAASPSSSGGGSEPQQPADPQQIDPRDLLEQLVP